MGQVSPSLSRVCIYMFLCAEPLCDGREQICWSGSRSGWMGCVRCHGPQGVTHSAAVFPTNGCFGLSVTTMTAVVRKPGAKSRAPSALGTGLCHWTALRLLPVRCPHADGLQSKLGAGGQRRGQQERTAGAELCPAHPAVQTRRVWFC